MVCGVINFGLISESLNVRISGSGEVISVPLLDSEQPSTTPECRQVDDYVALQTLYLLDRFGVSDEVYHELTQVIVLEITCTRVHVLAFTMYTDKVYM